MFLHDIFDGLLPQSPIQSYSEESAALIKQYEEDRRLFYVAMTRAKDELYKYRVKVSSLYIAQAKQKHGIIERDCYNNSKKDNPKQPQCPPEKVKLIEEALRHFKMIP